LKFNATFAKRFSEYVGSKTPTGCTEWNGYLDKRGYARIRTEGSHKKSPALAHRAIFTFVNGEIPEGKVVMHTCDNPKCVNLEHLVLGTSRDNTSDMIAKGRHGWREKTPWQKLSAADARLVKRLRAMEMTQERIAGIMGVSRPLISLLLGGKLQYAI
jgi:hypothetical protein